jgi:hypothetical protein
MSETGSMTPSSSSRKRRNQELAPKSAKKLKVDFVNVASALSSVNLHQMSAAIKELYESNNAMDEEDILGAIRRSLKNPKVGFLALVS